MIVQILQTSYTDSSTESETTEIELEQNLKHPTGFSSDSDSENPDYQTKISTQDSNTKLLTSASKISNPDSLLLKQNYKTISSQNAVIQLVKNHDQKLDFDQITTTHQNKDTTLEFSQLKNQLKENLWVDNSQANGASSSEINFSTIKKTRQITTGEHCLRLIDYNKIYKKTRKGIKV